MFKANQLIRFFRFLDSQRSRQRKNARGDFFNPVTDELEARRLMTLNVWIDQDNILNIASTNNLGQALTFDYTPGSGATFGSYTIRSLVSTENFFLTTNNPIGLTVTKTDFTGGSYATLTVTESATGVLGSIAVATGSGPDSFTDDLARNTGPANVPASLLISSGAGADQVNKSTGLASSILTFDGGSGEDLLTYSATLSTATNVTQNIQSAFNPGQVYFTSFMNDNFDSVSSTMNLANVENINNQLSAALAAVDQSVNGFFGSAAGSLATVNLRSVDNYFISAASTSISVFGYNTNDDFQVTTPVGVFIPGVQVNASGLPVSRYYGMTNASGVLKLLGLDGNDAFSVQSGAAAITNVSITGGSGSDLLLVGNDSGAATFSGDSSDVVRLTGSANNDTVGLSDGSASDLALVLNGVTQSLVGGPRIEINTLAGNDLVNLASTTNVNISVDAGDDSDTVNASGLTGATSNINIGGGTGNDNISGPAAGTIVISGGIGNDTINSNAASQIFGDEGNDSITGSSGKDSIFGGAGDDNLVSGNGSNYIDAGQGNDFLTAGNGQSTLLGGEGSDTFSVDLALMLGTNLEIQGGEGIDGFGVSGLVGDDNIFFNTAVGSPQTVEISSPGLLNSYSTTVEIFGIYPKGGNNKIAFAIEQNNSINSIQFNAGTGTSDISIAGNGSNDSIEVSSTTASQYNVTGLGPVMFFYGSSVDDKLTIDGRGGDDSIKVNSGIENFTQVSLVGGDGNDFLSADATLIGGAGDDTLQGGAGNDSLDGGLGNDVFLLSAGTDTMSGGAGFNQVVIEGVTGSNNLYLITQNNGLPISFFVNGTGSLVSQTGINQIYVLGSTSTDSLILLGNSFSPVPILAMLGSGNDSINTFAASAQQTVTAYGDDGQDDYSAGPGIDNFYGGDDFDTFTENANSVQSSDTFDGGSGLNQLIIQNVAGGTTTLIPIPGGFDVSNTVPGAATSNARNVAYVQVIMASTSNGVFVSGTNADDTIRTFDSDSGIVPPVPVNTIAVAGLAFNLNISNVSAGQSINILGQGGNDTFQAMGNAGANVNFFGDSGNDTMVITQESKVAYFTGDAGTDGIQVTGTVNNDVLVGDLSTLTINYNGSAKAVVLEAEVINVDAGAGNDTIQVINLPGAPVNLSFHLAGGDGNDIISGPAIGSIVMTGGIGNDTITANAASQIFGNEGHDTITGSAGNDTVSGGSGDDVINAGTGDDYVDGNDGIDTITAGGGNDTLDGNAGADWFIVGIGAGTTKIDGGTGNDLLWLQGTGAADAVSMISQLGALIVTSGAMTVNLYDTESYYIDLGNENDSLTLGDVSESPASVIEFAAGAGQNTVSAMGTIGNDQINASVESAGNILATGMGYLLKLSGVNTADLLVLDGGDGNDSLKAAAGVETYVQISLSGGAGNDYLSADATLSGGSGNDTLQGGAGNDSLDGGAGDDLFLLSAGTDTVIGGSGFDILQASGSVGADNDFIVNQPNAAPVQIIVNANTYQAALTGIDQISIQGSTGDDALQVIGDSAIPVDVFATLAEGDDFVNTVASSIAQRVTAYGQAGDDSFVTGPGTDLFYGGDDFDDLIVSAASVNSFDYLDGGTGYNMAYVDSVAGGTSVITAIASGFLIRNTAGTGATTALNVGGLTVDGASGVAIQGSNNDDVIRTFDSTSDLTNPPAPDQLIVTGLPGEILIYGITPASIINITGEGGNDTFQAVGNAGASLNFSGNSGNDRFVVNQETALASFNGGDGIDTVSVEGTVGNDDILAQNNGSAVEITLNGVIAGTVNRAENLVIDALSGNDSIGVITGGDLANTSITGGDGDDIVNLFGNNSGNFVVDGGAGTDSISGPDGTSTFRAYGGSGNDAISFGLAGGEAFGGDGDDFISGSSGNDSIYGEAGNDILASGAGNDIVSGGADNDLLLWSENGGNDTLQGGTGSDAVSIGGTLFGDNTFELRPNAAYSNYFEVLIAGNVIMGAEVEQVSLRGGTGKDNVAIGDLINTGINHVDVNILSDQSADFVSVMGTVNSDYIILGGSSIVTVTGLPWQVNLQGAAFSATTLIDGILIDGGMMEDTIVASNSLTAPVLVTLRGGLGSDEVRVNSPTLGDNTNRVTVDTSADVFSDIISLRNGRNLVLGSAADTLLFEGTEAADVINLSTDPAGRLLYTQSTQNLSSSNDISGFAGTVNVNAMGGDDVVNLSGFGLSASVLGGLGNDSINASGMAVAVSLYGENGDDSLVGGSGNDQINGGDGWNTLIGSLGNDVVNGGAGTDYFVWNEGDGFDYFTGNGGQDYVVATGNAGGNNSFDVKRYNTVYYMEYNGNPNQGFEADGVPTAEFNAGAGSIARASVQGMNGIAVSRLAFFFDQAASASMVVDGTNADDNLTASVNPYSSTLLQISGLPYEFRLLATPSRINNTLTVQGLGGNDTLKSTGAADALTNITLDGGDGNDLLSADAILLGGPGNDTFIVPVGPNTIDGGDGFDTILVEGTNGPDSVTVNQTSAGVVTLTVNASSSTNVVTNVELIDVYTRAGNDIVTLSGNGLIGVNVHGGEGDDLISAAGASAAVTLYGEAGDDTLNGGLAADYLVGGEGNNQLQGNQGDDTAIGGSGVDYFIWNAGDGLDSLTGDGGQDNVDAFGAVGVANNFAIERNFTAYSLAYNGDENQGFVANDVESTNLVSGIGSNATGTIQDMTGIAVNRVAFNFEYAATATVIADGSDKADNLFVNSIPYTATLLSITGLSYLFRMVGPAGQINNNLTVRGLAGNDTITSSASADALAIIKLEGNEGNDFLSADAILLGGPGNDTFFVPYGSNTIDGGDDFDTILVEGTNGADQIGVNQTAAGVVTIGVNGNTSTNVVTNVELININAYAGNDSITLSGTGTIAANVHAGEGNDLVNAQSSAAASTLYGESGNDSLYGGNAADYIDGGDGTDLIVGNGGNDSLFGGADADTFSWAFGDGSDTVDGGTGSNLMTFTGNAIVGNNYNVRPNQIANQAVDVTVADKFGSLSGVVMTSSVQQLNLIGSNDSDFFEIQNLTGTSILTVNADFGQDTVADRLNVVGSANNDNIRVTGGNVSQVTGLPWAVNAFNAAMNGNLLVDGIAVDGSLGEDYMLASGDLTSPVLVTLTGGRGSDSIIANAGVMGVNPVRVLIDATQGTLPDTIQLLSGRNQVFSSPDDLILINGSVNNDTVSVQQTVEGTVFTVNGRSSTNDLAGFQGVIHIELMGGNDTAVLDGYTVPTSVMGGDGNDFVNAALLAVPVTLYGGLGDDTLTGGSAADYLDGGDGSDEMTGKAGNDEIYGGADIDSFFWAFGDGNDNLDGGTGQNNVIVSGHRINNNRFTLSPFSPLKGVASIELADAASVLQATILTASIQQIDLVGGEAQDTFNIADLTGTAVTIINTSFGQDTVADEVSVNGTANNDHLMIGGSQNTSTVSGLPWIVSVTGAQFSGSLLVDTIRVDAGLGDDNIQASATLTQPVLLHMASGRGFDELLTNAPALGANPYRVTLDGLAGVSSDLFRLYNGRNRVLGKAADLILVEGSANNDNVSLTQSLEGTIFNVNGVTSTNDLSQYAGVIHVDLLGGNDTALLSGYAVPTSVMGGDGADLIDSSLMAVSTTLYGGSGNDTINGGSAGDEIDGGSGNDDIRGNAGIDSLSGGDGNDDFLWFAGSGLDYVDGGDGDDWTVYTGAGNVKNAFTITPLTIGGASSDPGLGLGNSNRVLVTHANAEIAHIGDVEALTVNGGNDCDNVAIGNLQTTDLRIVDVVFSLNASGGAVSTWATNLPDTITITADLPNQISVNGLAVPVRVFNTDPTTAVIVHGGFGADNIEVDPQAEAQATIVVEGGAGNDNITGGSIIIGGAGNNLLIGSDAPNTIVGGVGSDTIHGLGSGDLLFGDAQVAFIDGGKDDCDYIGNLVITPTSTGAPDLIDGGEGDDTMNGNIGNDTLHGGAGNNLMGIITYKGVLFPEPGDDLIDALNGNNEVHSGEGNDTVNLGNGNNCVFGGEGNNVINVGNGNNRIVTGTGNDAINTGNGNNTIFAGAGNDTVNTGTGNDVLVLGAGNDVANMGPGNDLAWGEDGNDFIVGGLGNDSIYGGNGNDVLWGGTHATQPLTKGQTHALLKPWDGDDVIAGEGGFDMVDGGTGSNVMDAGADNIRETMVGSGGWDTAYIHKNEGKYQDILKNHSKRYTLIPYGSMPIALIPPTPVDCTSPINIVIPNPLSGATAKPAAKKALPGSLAGMFGGFKKK